MKNQTSTPVRAKMCATCPFRPGSPYADLAPTLAASAITEASRICHSTGSSAINYRTGKPPALCKGARNVQIDFLYNLGFLTATTDEAWSARCREMGLPEPVIQIYQ